MSFLPPPSVLPRPWLPLGSRGEGSPPPAGKDPCTPSGEGSRPSPLLEKMAALSLRVSGAFVNKPSAEGLPKTVGGKGRARTASKRPCRSPRMGLERAARSAPPQGPQGSSPVQVCVRNRFQVCTCSRPSSAGRHPAVGALPRAPGLCPREPAASRANCFITDVRAQLAIRQRLCVHKLRFDYFFYH